jgi:hypothetical protein
MAIDEVYVDNVPIDWEPETKWAAPIPTFLFLRPHDEIFQRWKCIDSEIFVLMVRWMGK